MSVENDGNGSGGNNEESMAQRIELDQAPNEGRRRLPRRDDENKEAPDSVALIRPAEPVTRRADAAAILHIITQPHAIEHMGRIHPTKTPDELEPADVTAYYRQHSDYFPLLAVTPDGTRALGTLTLSVDLRKHSARFIVFAVDGEEQKHGVGTKLARKGLGLMFAPTPLGFGLAYGDAGTMTRLAGRRDVNPAPSRLLQDEGFLPFRVTPNGGDSWDGHAYVDREVLQLMIDKERYLSINRRNMASDAQHVRNNQALPPLARSR